MSISAGEEASSIQNTENDNEAVIRKIFIAHVNSYQGKAVAKQLPDFKNHTNSPSGKLYEIYGSLQISDEIDNEIVESYAPRILDPTKGSYMANILECEIIVYDIGTHSSQVNEAQKVLELLEQRLEKCERIPEDLIQYFILISTPMVWAKTPPNADDLTAPLKEYDYRKRRSHPCYLQHQHLERDVINAQNRHKGKLRTVVVCPGVTYGGRNDILHYIFKRAFYNKEFINVYQKDRNTMHYLPLIYINDLAQMIFNIIERFPPEKVRYIFAVQSNLMSTKTFASMIAKSLTGSPVKVKICNKQEMLAAPADLISQRVYHYLNLNLIMTPTYFKGFPFTFNNDLEEMGNRLADEFRRERNMMPIKVIVDGPPCVGKTTLCKALAEQYELHYIDPLNLVFNVINSLELKILEAKKFLQHLRDGGSKESVNEGELEDELTAESKEAAEQRSMSVEDSQLTEGLEKQMAEWHAELTDLTEYVGTLRDDDHIGFDYMKKCLVEVLTSKPCSENQGYVIDCFPFDYNQTAEIFPAHLFHPSKEQEDRLEKNFGYSIKPTIFIMFVAPDDIICKRAMAMPEKEAVLTRNTEVQMFARLEKYHERTEEDVACATFFNDHDITPIIIKITPDTTPHIVLEQVKKQIGPPHTYPLARSQIEEIRKTENRLKREKELEDRKKQEQIEREVIAAREEKLQKWAKKFEDLKRQEQEILEAKSLPLRSYLCKYVLPTLTEGLLKVAESRPDDPIDFLAEYLFQCNPTGHVLDPAYSEDVKRLLLKVDYDQEQVSSKQDEGESKHENMKCDDSFINYQIDTKGSFITLKKKDKLDREPDRASARSSSSAISNEERRKSGKKIEKMKEN